MVEGRDIGSRVFPDTPYKFFFQAATEVRAARRFEQLRQAGEANVTLADVRAAVEERDRRDSSRAESPLMLDDSYVVIDTGVAGPEEVVERMLSVISELRRGRRDG